MSRRDHPPLTRLFLLSIHVHMAIPSADVHVLRSARHTSYVKYCTTQTRAVEGGGESILLLFVCQAAERISSS